MRRYLLDTHTAIWFFNGDKAMSEIARNTILDLSNVKYLSMASVWELAIKISIGKLKFPQNTSGFIRQIRENGFTLLPISESHAITLETLPMIHRDPFDRLLIATALAEEITLITADENIAHYNVPQIW